MRGIGVEIGWPSAGVVDGCNPRAQHCRGLAPPTSRVWLRAICGGALLAAPIWLSNSLAPNEPWWRDRPSPTAPPEGMSAGSEAVLATQSFLLEHALSDLADERPGVDRLSTSSASAPYGREDVFRKDVRAAQRVMNERWNTSSSLAAAHPTIRRRC